MFNLYDSLLSQDFHIVSECILRDTISNVKLNLSEIIDFGFAEIGLRTVYKGRYR